jgi:hypothetical protein
MFGVAGRLRHCALDLLLRQSPLPSRRALHLLLRRARSRCGTGATLGACPAARLSQRRSRQPSRRTPPSMPSGWQWPVRATSDSRRRRPCGLRRPRHSPVPPRIELPGTPRPLRAHGRLGCDALSSRRQQQRQRSRRRLNGAAARGTLSCGCRRRNVRLCSRSRRLPGRSKAPSSHIFRATSHSLCTAAPTVPRRRRPNRPGLHAFGLLLGVFVYYRTPK